MKHTTSAWVAGTTAMPRPSCGLGGLDVPATGAVARRGWFLNQQMATIKHPARHLGTHPT
jgi:hypothetical protein